MPSEVESVLLYTAISGRQEMQGWHSCQMANRRKAVNGMNERQKRFADEYLIDLNCEAAAIRAGYSPKYARGNAHKLVANSCIQEYIQQRKQDRVQRTEITQDRVIQELALIAFSNAADYAAVVEKQAVLNTEDGLTIPLYDSDGNKVMYRTVEPVLTEELSEDQKKALSVIKKGRDGFEVKPYDKVRALELLGKHLGMFEEKLDVKATIKDKDPLADLTTEELKKLIGDG